MKTIPFVRILRVEAIILATLIWMPGWTCSAQTPTSNAPVAQQVGAVASDVTQSTLNTAQTAWQRIDEKRLKNRTPDEIVAWVLMGLLVGGLLYRFSKLSQGATIVVGLVGAFVGGILANLFQLDFGLGPVLIRYEELLCSLVGGLALFFALKWFSSRKAPQAAAKAPAK